MKRALITGVFGQDGSYLAELLFSKGYEVHGVVKKNLSEMSNRIKKHLISKGIYLTLHECNLNCFDEVLALIKLVKPDELYHVAATHYSSASTPIQRNKISRKLFKDNILSTSNIIHGIYDISKTTRLVLASTCMVYDDCKTSLQDETTNYETKSVYGLSRISASDLLKIYRNDNGLHLSTAILYNHESPRRTESYVTQKIAKNLAKIINGEINKFSLGSLDSRKDWGYAKDYVYGMWLMAQQASPDDYILATGSSWTVGEFAEIAFSLMGIKYWKKHIEINTNIVSRTDVVLVGNPQKAEQKLLWKRSMNFQELVEVMVKAAVTNSLD